MSDEELPLESELKIKIIGVGGAGNNAIDRLKLEDLREVDLAAVNTDSKVLNNCLAPEKVLIGRHLTRGLGTGGDAEVGRQAAEADREALTKLVEGADLVFLLAGLGGGTSSGAGPVLADLAVQSGALVLPFVTMPFAFEGSSRYKQAEESLAALRSSSHAVVPLPNNVILQQIDSQATALDAFEVADTWIAKGVRAVWSLIYYPGLINVDFASLRRAFQRTGGRTLFGFGSGNGPDAVEEALQDLALCPLLHTPETSRRADCLIVNITGGTDLSMTQVSEIMAGVGERFCSRDDNLFGAVIDDSRRGEIEITVIGTTDLSGSAPAPTVRKVVAQEPVAARPKPEAAELIPLENLPQTGFAFLEEAVERGCFSEEETELYDGYDLDKPTYLRKGIRIPLN